MEGKRPKHNDGENKDLNWGHPRMLGRAPFSLLHKTVGLKIVPKVGTEVQLSSVCDHRPDVEPKQNGARNSTWSKRVLHLPRRKKKWRPQVDQSSM